MCRVCSSHDCENGGAIGRCRECGEDSESHVSETPCQVSLAALRFSVKVKVMAGPYGKGSSVD